MSGNGTGQSKKYGRKCFLCAPSVCSCLQSEQGKWDIRFEAERIDPLADCHFGGVVQFPGHFSHWPKAEGGIIAATNIYKSIHLNVSGCHLITTAQENFDCNVLIKM